MMEALSILFGPGTVYNTRETGRRGQVPYAAELFRAKHEDNRRPEVEQLETLWGDYQAISGELVAMFAEECIESYPNVPVILTVRDNEQKWLQSCMDTLWWRHRLLSTRFFNYVDDAHAYFFLLTRQLWKYMFWNDLPNHGIRKYREHNAMVQRLAAGRVLVYNVKQGWGPLCEFLGKEVPSVPFPNVNETAEHRFLFKQVRNEAWIKFARRLTLRAVLPSLIVGVMVFKRTWLQELVNKIWR